MPRQVK
jgi:hypothetical protein